jgi:carbonic anhydrase
MSVNSNENLISNNKRFINNKPNSKVVTPADLSKSQSPHTIIITCADSRVPPELIFDAELGELFVIRVAGNTATNEVVGSAEYAAANLGSTRIIIMGHSACGAVSAAVESEKSGTPLPSPALESVVAPIRNSAKVALSSGEENVIEFAINHNINSAINQLRENSTIIAKLESEGKLSISGAKYDLASGCVHFL